MSPRKAHPRVPADAGAFFLTLALGIRQVMLLRHGDGRDVGMGESIRLYLIHTGELPLPPGADVLKRLDALRETLETARSSARARAAVMEAAAHG